MSYESIKLQGILRVEVGKEGKEVDVLDYMGRLALELIAQAGMGYSFGALEGKNNEYSSALKRMVSVTFTFIA